MTATIKNNALFTITYSIHLENMMCTLLGRFDKTLIFIQIFLGVAVITNKSPILIGLAISALATIQFVWQPSIKAAEAKASHDRWLVLFNNFNNLSEKKLSSEIALLSERDGHVLCSLKLAAHKSACLQLNLPYDSLPKMTFWQKIFSRLAGSNVVE